MTRPRAAIILAAGQGTRMKSALPKVLHPVGARPLLLWAADVAERLACAPRIAVIGANSPRVEAAARAALGPGGVAVQDPPRGTADAVKAAGAALGAFEGDIVILYGDAPLIRAQTVERMFAVRAEHGGLVVLGFSAADPTGYGRLILDGEGRVARIVEEKDAAAEERAMRLCNSGVLVADRAMLFQLLSMVGDANAKKEFYLTDVVGLGRSAGFFTHVVEAEEAEVLGVNSRAELAEAEAAFQARARAAALEAGVTLIDPNTVYFSHDTHIEPDVTIEPNVVFGPGVSVRGGARIRGFSHIEGAEIGPECEIGPFARLRPGARLARKVKIGNFVEVKKSNLGEGVKANHLAYIGDADVGARANIGAGAITCNYDGYDKHRTTIGADVFIGSDTALVAPVTIGDGAYTAAGSVITKDVAPDALAVARGKQSELSGWAEKFRAAKSKPAKGGPE